jgi:predicted nuclease of predicted toxin-antitoxin system
LKLLLDEMFSPRLAAGLRSRGHDVVATKEHVEWQALADPDVVSLACRERRAVVTNNVRDFRLLHAELVAAAGDGHAGMMFVPANVPRTRAATGRLVAALEAKLAEYPGDDSLANGVRLEAFFRSRAVARPRCRSVCRGCVAGGEDAIEHRWPEGGPRVAVVGRNPLGERCGGRAQPSRSAGVARCPGSASGSDVAERHWLRVDRAASLAERQRSGTPRSVQDARPPPRGKAPG